MKVLVVDVGGSNVKILATGQREARRFASGPDLGAAEMAAGVKKLARGWDYDAVVIGYPGVVKNDQPVKEPVNLGTGWVGFDYRAAFGCPVKIINDAAMQALGSFREGKLLFLGLGTGLGSAMVIDGRPVPMELAHLPYRRSSFEQHVGKRARKRLGQKKWRKRVRDVIERLRDALVPDEVVIGGGGVKQLGALPERCRAGDNALAFAGGFRLWASEGQPPGAARPARKTPRR